MSGLRSGSTHSRRSLACKPRQHSSSGSEAVAQSSARSSCIRTISAAFTVAISRRNRLGHPNWEPHHERNGSSIFDAVIVGSGAGGCAAAYRLASAGLRVALVEKGKALPLDASTLDFDKVVHQGLFKSKELWRDGRGRQFAPEEYFNVGGKTKWYGAALLRYGRTSSMRIRRISASLGPSATTNCDPTTKQAEALLGIRTFDTEPDLLKIITVCDATLRPGRQSRCRSDSRARSSIIPGSSRFDGFASVAGLKSDGETVFLSRLRSMPNVTLADRCRRPRSPGQTGQPTAHHRCAAEDGRILHAEAVLLAAGALHSPRILARYLDRSGLAEILPSAQLVGRNLKLHLLTAIIALSASRKTDLIRKTTLLLNDALPHSSVQPLGFDGELIATLVPRVVPGFVARHVGHRAYGFFLQTEDGSHPGQSHLAGDLPTLDYDAARLSRRGRANTQAGQRFPVFVGPHWHAHVLATDRAGRYCTRMWDARDR